MRALLLAALLFVGLGGGVAQAATPPPPTNVHVTAKTQTSISIAWSGTTKRYAVWLDGAKLLRLNAKSYTYTGLGCGTSHTLGVRSVNGSNQVSAVVSITASTNACTQPPPSGLYTVPSAACTSRTCVGTPPVVGCSVAPAAEVVLSNQTANHTVWDGTATWGTEVTNSYWANWQQSVANNVKGDHVGTTDELMQYYACRWGFNADLFRAVGVQESDWHQLAVGDNCGEPKASYGIIQIKNRYCDGSLAWGGYPDTQQSTPLALDFYGAYLRSCFDGAFYDGGAWLYNGRTVGSYNDWNYVLWGCVGSWFSGGWYEGDNYIASVKTHLANKDWP